jgi:hypothetical protein
LKRHYFFLGFASVGYRNKTHPQRHKLQNLTGLESAIRHDGRDDGLIRCGPPRQWATARSDWIPEWVGNEGIFRE